jgi:hypothetical protein
MNAVESGLESVIDADRQLNEQVRAGSLRDAYERWYDEDVVMDENGHYAMKGKAANRARQEAIGQVIRAYGRRLISSAVEGDRSFSEWEFDLEYAGVRYTLKQVSVREWQNSKVIRERFYYHAGTSGVVAKTRG